MRDYAQTWQSYQNGVLEDARCPVCGLYYVHDSPTDRQIHRVRHRSVIDVYEPKADTHLAKLHIVHGVFIPVDAASPRRLRNRLEQIAVMFRRELGYDFAPYQAAEKTGKLSRHWLIATTDGRPIGGFSARRRKYRDALPRWEWAWVWVIPSERHHGHTQRIWSMLKAAIPTIEPDPPFSSPIARFFRDRDDVSERIRDYAQKSGVIFENSGAVPGL